MRLGISKWLGGMALAAVLALGCTSAANAGPACGGSGGSQTGNLILTPPEGSDDCIISGSVSAEGSIQAIVPGKIEISGTVTANTAHGNGNILLKAGGNIKTGPISTSGGAGEAIIEIDANQDGGNTVFTVGSSSDNGVGAIDNSTSTGGGDDPVTNGHGVFITNGDSNSTGGITVSANAINVTASGSKAGDIYLNAQQGMLQIEGAISASQAGGQRAGIVYLLADTIKATGTTSVVADQTSGAAASLHGVTISANTVDYSLSSGAFTVSGNGNQISSSQKGGIFLLPTGAISLSSTGNAAALEETVTFTQGTFVNPGPITYTDTVGVSFAVTANGDHAEIIVSGGPTAFSGVGAVSMQSKGSQGDNLIALQDESASDDLTISNSDFVLDASASESSGAAAGTININVNSMAVTSANFSLLANGPLTTDGRGGTITYQSASTTLDPSSSAVVSANGSNVGSGAGGNITFTDFSDYVLGNAAGQFSFSAKGGATNGDGGSIGLTTSGNITVAADQAFTMDVSVPGSTGHGGGVNLFAGGSLTFPGSGYNISADAGTDEGPGGSVFLQAGTALTVGSGEGAVEISAVGAGDGQGGTVNITSTGSTLSIDAEHIDVSAGDNGTGGNISLNSGGDMTLAGTFDASGGATDGQGGTITVNSDGNITSSDNVIMQANANGDQEDGGTISVTAVGDLTLGTSAAQNQLVATGAGGGSGGNVTVSTQGNVTVNSNAINVSAGTDNASNGNGGIISLTSNNMTLATVLDADARGDGTGGDITLAAQGAITLSNPTDGTSTAMISANGGDGDGFGGNITITQSGSGSTITVNTDTIIGVDGNGAGDAGTITVQMDSGDINIGGIDEGGVMAALPARHPLSPRTGGTGTLKYTAVANGTGNGGTVIHHGGTNVTVVADPLLAKAKATGSNGNGGNITIDQVKGTMTVQTNLDASGQGTGHGGSITLQATTKVDLTKNALLILARGGDNGEGGHVTITNGVITLNDIFNDLMDVKFQLWAGSQRSDPGTFGGTLVMNGVTCTTYLNGTNWPLSYRDCANPAAPSSTDVAIVNDATAASGTLGLTSVNYVLWLFNNADSFNTFVGVLATSNLTPAFTNVPPSPPVGLPPIQTVLFESTFMVDPSGTLTTLPSNPLSLGQAKEDIVHELGHVFDYVHSIASGSTALSTAAHDDTNFLDSQGAPCQANGIGPFNGVIDINSGDYFCGNADGSTNPNGTTFRNFGNHYKDGNGNLLSNSGIAAASSPLLNQTPTVMRNSGFTTPGLLEFFAQLVSFQYTVRLEMNPFNYLDTTADGLLKKGFYDCSQGIGAAVAGVAYTRSHTYSCN